MSFKNNEYIFGGGRLNVKGQDIPLSYEELMKVYEEANKTTVAKTAQVEGEQPRRVVVNK